MANSNIEHDAYSEVVAIVNGSNLSAVPTGRLIHLLDHAVAWHHARLNNMATDAFIVMAEAELNARLSS